MTEEQVRDVLARAVPEAPDSAADASPVVRAARRRRRRRTRVVAVSGLAAAALVGTLVGVQALGDDETNVVADPPSSELADPYTTAACPPASEPWTSTPVEDLDQVTAVRYCARGTDEGFFIADGPPDALVDGIGLFIAAVRSLAPADPGRCAAVTVMPSDSRLLLLLADGTSVGVPAGFCQDAAAEGRTLDGNDLTRAFLDQLRVQRDEHPYAVPAEGAPIDCVLDGTLTPALPGRETLVAAVVCSPDGSDATSLDENRLSELVSAWATAEQPAEGGDSCADAEQAPPYVLARTDRGDLVRLDAGSCDFLLFQGDNPADWFQLDLTIGDLTG